MPHAVPRFCPSEIFYTQSASPDMLINVCKEEEEEEEEEQEEEQEEQEQEQEEQEQEHTVQQPPIKCIPQVRS